MRLRAVLAFLTIAGALLLSGCSSHSEVPPNVVALQHTQFGALLADAGYTPVRVRYDGDDKIIGFTYANCGDELNLSKCMKELKSKATVDHPVIEVDSANRIITLTAKSIGPQSRVYVADVPPPFKDFTALSPEQRTQLLGMMHIVTDQMKDASDNNKQVLLLPVFGQVTAWVDPSPSL